MGRKTASLAAAGGILLAAPGCVAEQDPSRAETAPNRIEAVPAPKSKVGKLATSQSAIDRLTEEAQKSVEDGLKRGNAEINIMLGACSMIGKKEGDGIKVYFVPNPGVLEAEHDSGATLSMSVAYDPESEDFIYGQRVVSGRSGSFYESHTVDDGVLEQTGFGSGFEEVSVPVELDPRQRAVTAQGSDLQGNSVDLPMMTVAETRFIEGDFKGFASGRRAQTICEDNTFPEPIEPVGRGQTA